MLTVAIVEDEGGVSELLRRYIRKFSEESGEKFKVFAYPDGVSFLSETEQKFDIVLMDIQMPIMDGMRTAKKLRAQDTTAAIIFVTNMAKFAVEGYEVNALDFIVKPVDYFVFALKFEKAVRLQKSRRNDFILVPSAEGIAKMSAASVRYVEVDLHFVIYHTDDGDIRVRGSMKETESRLSGKGFCRCSNSFLVNLARVDRIDQTFVTVEGENIPISRSRKKEFLDAFSLFYR